MEETGDVIALFLPLPNVTYVTVVKKSELSSADYMNFISIAIKGRRFKVIEEMKKSGQQKSNNPPPSFFYEDPYQKAFKDHVNKKNASR
ncbi:MAG: hypothetical protein ACTSX6_04750 [Candidatus Heimdallarchaeaceae archaeon]